MRLSRLRVRLSRESAGDFLFARLQKPTLLAAWVAGARDARPVDLTEPTLQPTWAFRWSLCARESTRFHTRPLKWKSPGRKSNPGGLPRSTARAHPRGLLERQ